MEDSLEKPNGDDSGPPKKRVAKSATVAKVQLKDSFVEWTRQKTIYEGRRRQLQVSSHFSHKDLKVSVSHAEFATHLLEVHGQACYFCR